MAIQQVSSRETVFLKSSFHIRSSIIDKCMTVALTTITGVAVCGVIGLFVFQAPSSCWILMGGGAVIGGLSGIAIYSIIQHVKLNKYPATTYRKAEAVDLEEVLTKENLKLIPIILEEFSNKEWYLLWRSLMNMSDEEVIKYFKDEFENGLCAGTALALVDLMKERAASECQELLAQCSIKDIFAYQMQWEITAKLSDMNKSTPSEEIKQAFANSISDLFKYNRHHLKINPKIQEADFIKNISNKIEKHSARSFIIELDFRGRPRGHIVFVQSCAGFYRFYDSLSKYTGFYQFNSRDAMLTHLYHHLLTYQELSEINCSIMADI